jgi:hypothetical protein
MTGSEDKPALLKKLERDGRGEVVAHLAGRDEPLRNVKVARCFPWSLQEGFISILDKEGKELVLLTSLDGIDPESRKIIEEELRDKVFVPKIRRISRYRAEFDVVYITAETDRGEVTFQIRNRDDVRVLSPGRALFRDVDGNVYEVEQLRSLDRASQRHIEQYF